MKRSKRIKAVQGKKGFRFSDYCPGRKVARKSKIVAGDITPVKKPTPLRNDDVNILLVLRKRKPGSPPSPLVLKYSELDARVFEFESALGAPDYTDKKQEVEEGLARICNSADAFGAIYRARDRRTGEIVAMKEQFEGMSVATLREIDILIVDAEGVAADDSEGVYIVMEYVEYDLHRYLEAAEAEMSAEIKLLMRELLEGVKFLHDNMVMHRDLNPSNILVNSTEELKICDFGLSRRMDAAAGLYTPYVGTGWHRAPELLMGVKAYSEAVYMWAVGCVMAEMLLRRGGGAEAGRLEKVCRVIGDVLRSEFFPAATVTGAGFDLLNRLLSWDPSKRITAESALSHVWFEESN